MEKFLRGFTKINSLKTHCPKGHELSGDNLKRHELSIGKRSCRICANQRQKLRTQTNEWKLYKKEWEENNPEKLKQYNKNWNIKNRKEYSKSWDLKNPERRKEINNKHNSTPERIAYQKAWNKEHPRSFTGYAYETRLAMNEKRYIKDNTCQWYGCGLTFREVPIHVHHILPKSEYPEYETELWNLILYCGKHHLAFHVARNDPCVPLLRSQVEREMKLYKGDINARL